MRNEGEISLFPFHITKHLWQMAELAPGSRQWENWSGLLPAATFGKQALHLAWEAENNCPYRDCL